MTEAFIVLIIGIGLVGCGYILGVTNGLKTGSQGVVNELFRSGLLTPEKVLAHYANQGNERARDIMAALNKIKQENKTDAED